MVKTLKQSPNFEKLRKNITLLEKTFIPRKMKTNGLYTEKEQAKARAYKLLAHAEIEYYFETVAKDVVLAAYNKWQSDKKPSHVLMSVTSFMQIQKKIPESAKGTQRNEEGLIENRVQEYVSNYMGIIKSNNGVKEINLLKILLPIGIHLNELDTTFLSSINSFGHDRGEVAHRTMKTKSINDPFVEKKEVDAILNEISKLDTRIISLK